MALKIKGWSQLEKEVLELLDDLCLLPNVLFKVLIDYFNPIQWESKPFQVWELPNEPYGLTSDGTYLYISVPDSNMGFLQYTLSGDLQDTWNSIVGIEFPWGLDFAYPQNQLYVVDSARLCTLNFKKEIVSQWALLDNGRALKVDNDRIYVTTGNLPQILMYTRSGTLLKKFGKEQKGGGEGEFNTPRGLTVDEKMLYVCDELNNRVQVLQKETGDFSHQWGGQGSGEGQFTRPYSIHLSECVMYVGDDMSVQLFTCDGIFLQRLGQNKVGSSEGEFTSVFGLTVVCGQLYICDHRIQVFRPSN